VVSAEAGLLPQRYIEAVNKSQVAHITKPTLARISRAMGPKFKVVEKGRPLQTDAGNASCSACPGSRSTPADKMRFASYGQPAAYILSACRWRRLRGGMGSYHAERFAPFAESTTRVKSADVDPLRQCHS